MTVISASKFLAQNSAASPAASRGNDTAAKIREIQNQIKELTKKLTEYVQGIATGETKGSEEEIQKNVENMRAQLTTLNEQLAQLQKKQIEEAQQKKAEKKEKNSGEDASTVSQTAKKIDGYIDLYI